MSQNVCSGIGNEETDEEGILEEEGKREGNVTREPGIRKKEQKTSRSHIEIVNQKGSNSNEKKERERESKNEREKRAAVH